MRPDCASTTELLKRRNKILAFLMKGEASTKDICAGIGLRFPIDLEKVRGSLISLQKAGMVVKAVRATFETRNAYYSLINIPALKPFDPSIRSAADSSNACDESEIARIFSE